MSSRIHTNGCVRVAFIAYVLASVAGCERETTTRESPAAAQSAAAAAASSRAQALSIGSWNIEWFGDRGNGPGNETLQLENTRLMLTRANADIWGLEEIVDERQWERLKAQLPGYAGILATDRIVTNRGTSYSATEQKLGVLYRTSVVRVQGARLILTGDDADFAGRPPLEVRFRPTSGGKNADVIVIVVHMKARNDEGSWRRRQNASHELKLYLDRAYPTEQVLVVGDWNDGIGRSIAVGKPSPYADFVRDDTHYRFLSQSLVDRGLSSTTGRGTLIDHHLATNELAAREIPNSAEVITAAPGIRNYRSTTSDHFPVVSHFRSGIR